MNYGYIRVSTEHQNLENQQMEIERFCRQRGIKIDVWIEENLLFENFLFLSILDFLAEFKAAGKKPAFARVRCAVSALSSVTDCEFPVF